VPETAVVRRGGLTGLFVVREGRARLRWVALGAPVAGAVEVRAGLEPGEEIAVEADGLADGTPVSGTR
jgi:hypothetical protein